MSYSVELRRMAAAAPNYTIYEVLIVEHAPPRREISFMRMIAPNSDRNEAISAQERAASRAWAYIDALPTHDVH
jgi:hypothetical protein